MRYVAVGDSFTEGVGDELADGTVRGWADLVAAGLASSLRQPILYANMAVRGRKLQPIMTEQIDAALALDPLPTMISINGGGNDMLRITMDLQSAVELTEWAVRRCVEAGVHVLLVAGPNPARGLPFSSSFTRRGNALTDAIRPFEQRYPLTFVDNFTDSETHRAGYWSPDRLHLNAQGHARVAWRTLTALGHRPHFPLPMPAPVARRTPMGEVRYYQQHVIPWMRRHREGRSSGDGRAAKYGQWIEVAPELSVP